MKKTIVTGILTASIALSMATHGYASSETTAPEQTSAQHHSKEDRTVSTINYVDLYQETLNEIRSSVESASFSGNYSLDIPYIYAITKEELDGLGYDYLDINNDGIPELFIGVVGETGSLIAFSIIDDEVVRIAYRDYRYGASFSASGTFYEWGSNSAFHSIQNESIYTGVDLEYNWAGEPQLEPIKFYHYLAYSEFMSQSQFGYYTATNEDLLNNVNYLSIGQLTAVSDEEINNFKERMEEGYPFDYTPLKTYNSTSDENTSNSTNVAQKTDLLFGVTYLSDPYPCYVTFHQDGTYHLQANLGVGYGTDIGTYTIQNNQILCTILDRQWSGFVWDDVNTYSFFITDDKLTFQIVDTYYAKDAFGKTYVLENFCYMDNGDTLTTYPQLPTAIQNTSYLTAIYDINESATLVSGSLPKGLGLYKDGIIGGVPQETGVFQFVIATSQGEVGYLLKVEEPTAQNVEGNNDFDIIERIPTVDSNDRNYMFEVTGEFKDFLNVYLDGELLVDDVHYIASEGSTKIVISAQTMSQLTSGSHTINATFTTSNSSITPSSSVSNNSTSSGVITATDSSKSANVASVAQVFTKSIEPTAELVLPFTDVSISDWYYQYVRYMYETKTFSGVTNTTYEPNTGMTRAMMATVFYGMAGKPSTMSANFSDVADGVWYADAVNWLSQRGIDDSSGTFRPNELITREETAKMMYNFCTDQGIFLPLTTSKTANDVDSISENAKTAVNVLFSKGIFTGDSEGNFNPHNTSTRAEISVMMRSFMWATV